MPEPVCSVCGAPATCRVTDFQEIVGDVSDPAAVRIHLQHLPETFLCNAHRRGPVTRQLRTPLPEGFTRYAPSAAPSAE